MSRLAHLGAQLAQLDRLDEVIRVARSPDRAAEQDGVLENDGQSGTQRVQGQLGDIYPIDDYLSCCAETNTTDM